MTLDHGKHIPVKRYSQSNARTEAMNAEAIRDLGPRRLLSVVHIFMAAALVWKVGIFPESPKSIWSHQGSETQLT